MPDAPTHAARNRLIGGAIFLTIVLVAVWTLPLTDWLDTATAWIEGHPAGGRLLYFTGFILGTVCLVPGSVLAMSGGYLFGFVEGTALVSAGVAVGATVSCALGRGVAREAVAQAIAGNPRFEALDNALARRAFTIVVLTRVSLLLPYNLLNYAYGLTRIALRTYVVATTLGMLPAVALYVYIGASANDVESLLAGDVDSVWQGKAMLFTGIAALVVVGFVVHRTATRELKRQLGEQ